MDIFLIILLLLILMIAAWALLGKGDGSEEEKDAAPPEKIFRRRATDAEIEEQFPEQRDTPRRRKTDAGEESLEGGHHEVDDSFSLPYTADEIVSDTSRFRIFKRTLINSEIYAQKGDFNTAISLYEGVNERINDLNTNNKIDANIHYLKNYKSHHEEIKKEKKMMEQKLREKKGSEIKVSIDGPLTIPDKIQIGFAAPSPPPPPESVPSPRGGGSLDVDSLVERITRKLLESKILDKEREEEVHRYRKEIDSLKENLSNLIQYRDEIESRFDSHKDGRDLALTREKDAEIARLKSEFEGLNQKIQCLSQEKEETLKYLDDLKAGQKEAVPDSLDSGATSAAEREKEEQQTRRMIQDSMSQVNTLREEVRKLSETFSTVPVMTPVAETDKKPSITEARYTSPIPVTLDPKPILEILEKIPTRQTSPPRAMEIPGDIPLMGEETGEKVHGTEPSLPSRPSGRDGEKPRERREPSQAGEKEKAPSTGASSPSRKTEEEKGIKENIAREEVEGREEFELLKEYGKDQYDDSLSDEDIFSKILEDDKQKTEEDIEILGDTRQDREFQYDITDKDFDKKMQEEENFYKKFLQHNKRKKKELPILKVSYDFTRLPDEFSLSRDKNILEYSFYKYKPMLERAGDFIKKRRVRDAINYYKVVMSQNIPPEFKSMIRKNINDLTEYLEKYLTAD